MSLVLEVHNVLQVDARVALDLVEELLRKDVEESTDLADHGVLLGTTVHQVQGNGDGKLAAETLVGETWFHVQHSQEYGSGQQRVGPGMDTVLTTH